ncbi:MAG: hypothetical protein A3F85_03210 [Candidatus Ryanbacteria bacterium RIFCSPLOWO2_12_FULL_44_26]|nr:MAG: hypothetical protein A3F85_03210 [Candidatus Ryanbacteria bacterium RIFCSPLOWO2_12_FULL_44_26]
MHQEAGIIERAVADFHKKVISKIPGSEFIVSEDGSTDGTKDILLRIKEQYYLTLHMGDKRKGYTVAFKEALALATKDIIFFSDSDGQHDPNDFWKMYDLIGDYDMVIGWKKTRHDGLARLYLSKAFNAIISFGFSVPLHDSNCGFRLMKKEVVDFLLSENWHLRHCIGAELAIRAHRRGFRVTEVEVSHETRRFGTSRSLPVKKLPLIIVHILSGLFKLKRDNKKSLTHTDGNGRFWV